MALVLSSAPVNHTRSWISATCAPHVRVVAQIWSCLSRQPLAENQRTTVAITHMSRHLLTTHVRSLCKVLCFLFPPHVHLHPMPKVRVKSLFNMLSRPIEHHTTNVEDEIVDFQTGLTRYVEDVEHPHPARLCIQHKTSALFRHTKMLHFLGGGRHRNRTKVKVQELANLRPTRPDGLVSNQLVPKVHHNHHTVNEGGEAKLYHPLLQIPPQDCPKGCWKSLWRDVETFNEDPRLNFIHHVQDSSEQTSMRCDPGMHEAPVQGEALRWLPLE
mmetsp:Transcript_60098/g.159869  ORF Transcript_60098/g.159869 Transcript_60098/m.159869 type:complete len:272 (+) Transcript_60098:211-1026(+)